FAFQFLLCSAQVGELGLHIADFGVDLLAAGRTVGVHHHAGCRGGHRSHGGSATRRLKVAVYKLRRIVFRSHGATLDSARAGVKIAPPNRVGWTNSVPDPRPTWFRL